MREHLNLKRFLVPYTINNYVVSYIQYNNAGWPRKNGTGYFPQYMNAIPAISV